MFDLAPRIFLAVGAVILVLGAIAHAQGSSVARVALGMGAIFLLVAVAMGYAPRKQA